MTTDEAAQKLERAYRVKFDSDPDEVGKTIIDLASERIARGESFVWEEVNGFRKLSFHKEDGFGQLVAVNPDNDTQELDAEIEIEAKKTVGLSDHTLAVRNVNKRQADFCRFVAAGMPQGRAWELAGYKCSSRKNADICASKALKLPQVAAYLRSLKEAAWAKDVLTLAEKRKGLADIWRTPIGEIDANHPLAQEVKRKTHTDKDGNTFTEETIKMPGKLDALKLDAQLAGELKDNQSQNVGISLHVLNERIKIVDGHVVADTGILEEDSQCQ